METLLAQLIVAVGLLMGQNTDTYTRPSVQVVDPCTIGRIWEHDPDFAHCPISGQQIGGIYFHGLLYLNSNSDFDTLKGQSIFVHELAHWVQDKQGRHKLNPTSCEVAELEREAYDVQIRWAMQVLGINRKGAMERLGMDPLFLSMATACDRRDYRQ